MKSLLVLCLLSVFCWSCRSGLGREGTLLAHAPGQEYVPVLAYESDPEEPPGIQVVPIGHFNTDEELRPIGLCGPRVKIELRKEVLVEVNEGELQTGSTVPNPIREAKPDKEGAFIDSTHNTLTSMATAFVTANRVIENAERWTGHRIDWGHNGRLVIVPYAFVTYSFNCHYDPAERILCLGALGRLSREEGLTGFSGVPLNWKKPVENLLLDAAGSPDIVAHEAAHAVFAAIKPGLKRGTARALDEGLADTTAFLIALDDPDVVKRVLKRPGETCERAMKPHGCVSSSDMRLTATMMMTRRTTITGSCVQ